MVAEGAAAFVSFITFIMGVVCGIALVANISNNIIKPIPNDENRKLVLYANVKNSPIYEMIELKVEYKIKEEK